MKQKMTAVDVRALVLLLRKKLIGLRYVCDITNILRAVDQVLAHFNSSGLPTSMMYQEDCTY